MGVMNPWESIGNRTSNHFLLVFPCISIPLWIVLPVTFAGQNKTWVTQSLPTRNSSTCQLPWLKQLGTLVPHQAIMINHDMICVFTNPVCHRIPNLDDHMHPHFSCQSICSTPSILKVTRTELCGDMLLSCVFGLICFNMSWAVLTVCLKFEHVMKAFLPRTASVLHGGCSWWDGTAIKKFFAIASYVGPFNVWIPDSGWEHPLFFAIGFPPSLLLPRVLPTAGPAVGSGFIPGAPVQGQNLDAEP